MGQKSNGKKQVDPKAEEKSSWLADTLGYYVVNPIKYVFDGTINTISSLISSPTPVKESPKDKVTPPTITPSETLPKRKVPVIVWDDPDPQDHVDGDVALGDLQLDAMVTPGAAPLVYTPKKGHKLGVGTHKLRVQCDANDTFEAAAKEVQFTVRAARAKVAWPTPEEVVYVKGGFKLGKEQLNATVTPTSCPLTYSPAEGKALDAGVHTLRVEVTKPSPYQADAKQVSLLVKKAEAKLTWKPPAIVVAAPVVQTGGQTVMQFALTSSQLNAQCTDGESALVYSHKVGDVLPLGQTLLRVNHAASKNYGFAQSCVTLVVAASKEYGEGFEQSRKGQGFAIPLNPDVKKRWDDENTGLKKKAQSIMQAANDMSIDELIEFLDSQVDKNKDYVFNDRYPPKKNATVGKPIPYPNHIWSLGDGLVVRCKPNGDKFVNPTKLVPVPMFCIEVLKPGENPFAKSKNPQDKVAAKLSLDGELAPKGPKDTQKKHPSVPYYKPTDTVPPQNETKNKENTAHMDGTTRATHLFCRPGKLEQVIQHNDTLDIPAGTPLTAAMLGVQLAPGNGDITLKPTIGTKLKVGKDQSITITAAETSRYAKAEKTVKVNVVKAAVSLTWDTPDDMRCEEGGAKLTDLQLNAVVTPPNAGTVAYSKNKGERLLPGEYVIEAHVPATAEQEEARTQVTVTVLKGVPDITWAPPKSVKDTGTGVTLTEAHLNAVITPKHLPLVYSPPLGTRLEAGTHTLQVHTPGNAYFKSQHKQVSFTVTANKNK